jgi:hypothetical protein
MHLGLPFRTSFIPRRTSIFSVMSMVWTVLKSLERMIEHWKEVVIIAVSGEETTVERRPKLIGCWEGFEKKGWVVWLNACRLFVLEETFHYKYIWLRIVRLYTEFFMFRIPYAFSSNPSISSESPLFLDWFFENPPDAY